MDGFIISIEQKQAQNAPVLNGYLKELAPVKVRGRVQRFVAAEKPQEAYVFRTREHAETVLIFSLKQASWVTKAAIWAWKGGEVILPV